MTMQFDPRDVSTYPFIRASCVVLGLFLVSYCLHFALTLPPGSPEFVMRHIAALIVGTLLLLGTICI